MRRPKGLHLCLALVAMVGLGLFILACTGWNSWSPDGSQVVFGYYDSNTSDYYIGMYDVKAGRVRTLNPQELNSDGEHWMSAQWKKDGTGLWVFKNGTEKKFLLMDVNATTGEILETFEIPVADSDTVPLGDAVEWNGNLFLNIRPFTRVDLVSKKIVQPAFEDSERSIVFNWGDGRIAYLGVPSEDHSELGFLDPQTLAKNRLFDIEHPDPRLRGAEGVNPMIAADPSGARIALTTSRKSKEEILICDTAGVQKTLTPKLPYSEFYLGAPVWSGDGKRILLAGITPQKESMGLVFLADVDVDTGRTRFVQIAVVKSDGEDFYASFYLLTPVSLSPDGKTVAISTAGLEKDRVQQSDRALYLIDLTSNENKVTKIPPPSAKTKK